jgi:hypothetical protein
MDKEKRRSCSYLKEDFEEYDKGWRWRKYMKKREILNGGGDDNDVERDDECLFVFSIQSLFSFFLFLIFKSLLILF